MPRASARALQLPLFVSDPTTSPEVLARYEALRPVLTGQRSLRQQSQQSGAGAGAFTNCPVPSCGRNESK
jgi:hypothetical protein